MPAVGGSALPLQMKALGMVATKRRVTSWLAVLAVLAVAEIAAAVGFGVALTQTAQAQWFSHGDDRYPQQRRYRGGGGGFFGDLFSSPSRRGPSESGETYQQAPVDNSRAPAPRKPDPKAEPVTPTTSIVVLGDGMADWLAYGLEDAFADAPEVAIVRKNKQHSGLLRYDAKSDLDWWHVARDLLAQEKANYVVMMLGVGDRQNIREKDLAKEAEAEKKAAEKKAAEKKPAADKPEANKEATPESKEAAADKDEGVEQAIVAPEPTTPGKRANGIIEFRTEKWAEIYSKRIDETISALKSKGVPVFWVGLPSIRGPKSTADASYLNDLYRARAERAGAVYIDVWDGFVDEGGKFTTFGPDYEGQVRRLRSNDGVYFTKYGARKLAHYVEREFRRYMSNRSLQVSLQTGPLTPTPESTSPRERPLAGPVVPLTVVPGNVDELAGGQVSHPDTLAARVLVKGEPLAPPPGRADDFAWQRGSEAGRPAAAAPAAAATPVAAPGPTGYVEPAPEGQKPKPVTPKTAQAAPPQKPKPPPHTSNAPRPPAPIRPQNNPFGWFR